MTLPLQKAPEWLAFDLCPRCGRTSLDIRVWGEYCTNVECEFVYEFDED